MPAYHSSFNKGEFREACACLILPLKTNIRGPAPPAPGDTLDIADEILDFFRANVLFSNFEIQGGADRVLVYGTLYVHACLKKMENLNHEQGKHKEREFLYYFIEILFEIAKRTLQTYAVDTFSLPGDSGFPLGGMTPAPKNSDERGLYT